MAAAAFIAATTALAQGNGYDDTKHEVAVSYGAFSNSQWIDILENVTVTVFTGAHVTFDNERFRGPFSAEYFYRVKPWLGVGGIFTFGRNKRDMFSDGTKDGTLAHNYYTLLPAVKLDWLRKRYFGLYSKVGVGATLRTETLNSDDPTVTSDNSTLAHVNWQISLLGIEAGWPTIRGFVEVGTGEQGVFLAGLRYKF